MFKEKLLSLGLAGAVVIASAPVVNAQNFDIPGVGVVPIEAAVGAAALGSLGLALVSNGGGSNFDGSPTPNTPSEPPVTDPQGNTVDWSLRIDAVRLDSTLYCSAELAVYGNLGDTGLSWFGYWDVRETTGTGLASNVARWTNGARVVLANWALDADGNSVEGGDGPGTTFAGHDATFTVAHVERDGARTEFGQISVTIPSECSPLPVPPNTVAVIDEDRLSPVG